MKNFIATKGLECLLILALFLCSAFIAHRYLQKQDKETFYYQYYFEPAVLLACGKGFGIMQDGQQLSSLTSFLALKTQQFNCGDLPEHLSLYKTPNVRAWYYMLLAVSAIWMIVGVSWHAVNILLALLFASSIVASYALMRLGMNKYLAFTGGLLFATASTHLHYLFSLRDYGKAPFILWSLFIIALMVYRTLSLRALIMLSILFGVVIGLGYGFRPDVLMMIPPWVVSVLFLLPGRKFKLLGRNILLLLLSLLSFYLVVMPTGLVNNKTNFGTCLWHFPLLGLADSFTTHLHIFSSLYSWVYVYSDQYVYSLVSAIGQHFLHIDQIAPCSPLYDKVSGLIFLSIIKTFPADILLRSFSASYHVIHQFGLGQIIQLNSLVLTVFIIIIFALINFRWAIFLLLATFYFSASAVVMYQHRHYFHLQFWYWWMLGFLLQQIIQFYLKPDTRVAVIAKFQFYWRQPSLLLNYGYRIMSFFGIITLLSIGSLWLCRYYQTKQLYRIFSSYLTAKPLPVSYHMSFDQTKQNAEYKFSWPIALAKPQTNIKGQAIRHAKMLNIQLQATHCSGNNLPLSVYYTSANRYFPFAHQFNIDTKRLQAGVFNIFLPVYFVSGEADPMGIEAPLAQRAWVGSLSKIVLPIKQKNCIVSIREVSTNSLLPYWLILLLPADWQQQALYQQLK